MNYDVLYFLDYLLDYVNNIVCRKKIYNKDFNFIYIVLYLCYKYYCDNKDNLEYKKLFNKALNIFDYLVYKNIIVL